MRKSAHGRMKSLASITVAEPGGARGARPHSPCFQAKLRPEGPKYFFFETGPPPFSQGVDDRLTPHLPI